MLLETQSVDSHHAHRTGRFMTFNALHSGRIVEVDILVIRA